MKLLILLITLVFATHASAQWQQASGPEGAWFTNLTKVNGKLLAEVRSESLYRLEGERWTKLPATFALDYYPIKQDILLTRYDGVHLSTDEGASWQHVLNLNAAPRVALDADTAYVLHANALYRSIDGGRTWSELQHQPAIHSVTALNGILIAGAADGSGVLRSTDGGHSFVESGAGLPDTAVVGPLVTDPGFVYAGTNAGLFSSSDLGISWVRYEEGLPGGMPRGQKRLERSGDFAFLHTDDTVYIATLAGWKVVSTHVLAGIVEHESVIYAPMSGTIMTSFFLGDGWVKTTPPLLANTVSKIVSAGPAMMTNGASGIFRTTDDGNTWDKVSGLRTHLLISTGSTVFASGADGSNAYKLLRSHDQGGHWTELEVFDEKIQYMTALARTTSYVYAGFSNQDMLGNKWLAGGVYRSTDRGTTWETAFNGLPSREGVVVPIIALYADEEVQFASTIEGLYRSMDGGDNWVLTEFEGGEVGDYNPIYFQRIGNSLFAGSTNSIFRTYDLGATWSKVSDRTDFVLGIGRFEDSLYVLLPELTGTRMMRLNGNEWQDITHRLPVGVDPIYILEGGLRAYMGTEEHGLWVFRKTASVDRGSNHEVATYPNPASELVTIELPATATGGAEITISDLLGREVLTTTTTIESDRLVIPVDALADGVYSYTIETSIIRVKGKLTIRH